MAIWKKDGGNHVAELGAGFTLGVTREPDGFVAEVFGRQLHGAFVCLEDAMRHAEVEAHNILMGIVSKL